MWKRAYLRSKELIGPVNWLDLRDEGNENIKIDGWDF